MPSLEWNKNTWDKEYNWKLKGEEWSQVWGSSEAQWFSSIYPRIHRFIGCDNVLEIACGYGRWTKFLMQYTANIFSGVDLSEECIQYCKDNFKAKKCTFFRNDGVSLAAVSVNKFDFVFSFDSLVHVSQEVLQNYIQQILSLLKPDGVCFIHHSNFGEVLKQTGVQEDHGGYKHMRDQTTSSKDIYDFILDHGGKVICQEIIDWGGGDSIDCLTTFCLNDAYKGISGKRIKNSRFMTEANIILEAHAPYNNL